MHILPQTFKVIISKDSLAPKPHNVEANIVRNNVHRSAIIAIKLETFDKCNKSTEIQKISLTTTRTA